VSEARSLQVTSLAIGYGSRAHLAEGVDLSARAGELIALVGPNGAGKSTLLRVLSGLETPQAGHVLLDGEEVHHLPPDVRARRIAVDLPHHASPPHLRVRELVALGRHPYTSRFGRLGPADRNAVTAALRATGMERFAERELSRLSDGEAQKAHIARGIAQEAPLLLLDEPTALLDVTSRVEITRMLAELAHREGHIVVFSTHDLAIARETADRMWLMLPEDQRVAQGAPEDLVLDGTLGTVFSRRGVRFTAEGEAEVPAGDSPGAPARVAPLSVRLVGPEGPRLRWTRRALERAGFGVTDGGTSNHAARATVTVEAELWRIDPGGRQARSLLELVSVLRGYEKAP
jgi:iron complex transport system ATP-binding protein